MVRHGADLARSFMRLPSRVSAAPALFVRVAVSLAALVSFGAGVFAFVSGAVPAGENLPLAGAVLVLVAAITRRYGIALPGNGFSSYVLGVMLFTILDRGWAFAAIVAPFAMLVGDVLLRRLPLRAALSADNAWVVALTVVMLPIIVNGTFYLELALGQTIAWVDARLTLRWESVVYLVSAALALAWLAVLPATIRARVKWSSSPTRQRNREPRFDSIPTRGSRVKRCGCAVPSWRTASREIRSCCRARKRLARKCSSRSTMPASSWVSGAFGIPIPRCTGSRTASSWSCWHRSSR